jgi:hypothetical protein
MSISSNAVGSSACWVSRFLDQRHDAAAVVQAGQRVVRREVGELVADGLLLGDVGAGAEHADDRAAVVANDLAGDPHDPDGVTVPEPLLAVDGLGDRVIEPRQLLGEHERPERGVVQRLVLAEPEHLSQLARPVRSSVCGCHSHRPMPASACMCSSRWESSRASVSAAITPPCSAMAVWLPVGRLGADLRCQMVELDPRRR